jgi:uncharacterized protein (TIGR04255 family)
MVDNATTDAEEPGDASMGPPRSMTADVRRLPAFERPPVSEVALAVHFDPPLPLTSVTIARLWERWKDNFPNLEEYPELPPIMDELASDSARASIQFRVLDAASAAPIPRFWFLNKTGSELIQVQRDRLVHNWRRLDSDSPYPHYDVLRPAFKEELEDFARFLEESKIGPLNAFQCEITYVNALPVDDALPRLGELERVLAPWSGHFSDDFLSTPESVSVALRFPVVDGTGSKVGRLHISAQPVESAADGSLAVLLQLVARGRPDDGTFEGALRFLDLGHEWIVRGFASITSREMHELWGREDG